ncbi:MAG: hypothetical protein DRO65_02740 [Candidatus Altiarchaeales archaeon]|nr:MAG: hypothetical protein DRO65_02740 [Candidatus Altiarchaeales archaeon]
MVKKGQVALEFLITYGWAILIMGVVIAVAWQAGLFNIKGVEKEGWSGFWGVVPEDYVYLSNGRVDLVLRNDIDANITLINITMKNSRGEVHGTLSTVLIPGGLHVTTLGPDPNFRLPAGSKFRVFITITYNDSRIPNRVFLSSGEIWGTVESA